ncbi:Rha family transcriptional regulator [Fusobacterium animalis]|uniref:Rha family transcriptional regulator n=1 Tax=Fusobacterium animalis TaxID=76859 RepID=UPI0003FA01BC|nr:Rha family transcriptional regulator [Fusobacterium animalis]ALF22019.1 antirepressor [Fusobacterium animalis]
MNYVAQIEIKNGVYVVSSRVIAKQLGKRHSGVLRDLDKILIDPNVGRLKNQSTHICVDSENADLRSLIIPSFYQVKGQKRNYKEYLLTKDGFTLYMFNIQGYNGFKMAYINEFNRMEQALKEPKEQKKLPLFTEIKPTTWRGTPVIEIQDLAKLTNITDATIHWFSRNEKINLKSDYLREYKKENSERNYTNISTISVLYKEMVISLCKKYGVYEKYKDFIENYFRYDNRLECKTIEKPFNDKYYNEMYECMVKAYQFESQIEKIYEEQLLPLYNRIDKLNDLKRDTMLTPFYGMKYGNIFGKTKK